MRHIGGGKNKVFGIHFPIGSKEMGASPKEDEIRNNMEWEGEGNIGSEMRNNRNWGDEADIENEMPRESNRHRDPERQLQILEALQEKIEVMIVSVNGKVMPIDLSLENASKLGIESKMGHENDYFVYELKVPLIKSNQHQYSIGAKIGNPYELSRV